jgi:carbamoyltransferase
MLYSAVTYYTGFKVNSGEYKLMGLAPYGQPKYRELLLQHLVDIRPDGSLWLDMSYFNYAQGLTMTSETFHQLFGGPPRDPDGTPTRGSPRRTWIWRRPSTPSARMWSCGPRPICISSPG